MGIRKPRLFGTSGVRGATNIEITPELALKLSKAFADWLGRKGTVVLGRDTRYGAPMICHAIAAGLESRGMNVIDCGVLPTPALGHALLDIKADGGVMVTGSHMPPERLGLIYLDGSASYISDDKALEVEDRYFNGLRDSDAVIMDRIGTMIADGTRIERYMEFLKGLIDKGTISKLASGPDFRVVADPGNGTAVNILSSLIRFCGIEVLALHEEMRGDPERPPEPRKHTLGKTVEYLTNTNASFAAATDLDADRVLFIEEEGKVLSEDVIGAIFAKWVFKKCIEEGNGSPVCITPVNSSGLIEYVAKEFGVTVEYCKIGQPDTERALREYGKRAVFAYEESGKYYFARHVHWCDGILSTLFLLEIMAEREMSLKELSREFPRFYQAKAQFRCSDTAKERVYECLVKRFDSSPSMLEGRKKDITIDGFKRIFNDNSWLLLRPSGTEPLFRLYSDAMSQDRANELLSLGAELVKRSMEEIEI